MAVGLVMVALAALPACDDGGGSNTLEDATVSDSDAARDTRTDRDTSLPDPLDGRDGTDDVSLADAPLGDTSGPSDTTSQQDTATPQDTQTASDTTSADTGAPDMGDGIPRPTSRPDVTNPPAGASWRYGGGHGYPDTVDPRWRGTTVVDTLAELQAALDAAAPGDIVYVDDEARIDITDVKLCVPAGVWLASGRGRGGSPGALLYARDFTKEPRIDICGDDVRITGLRLHGRDRAACPPQYPSQCTDDNGVNCRDCWPTTIGIQTRGYDRLEIDNNELAGWSFAATWFTDAVDNHVHHNHIHHTQREGLGYGVVLTRGGDGLVTVTVEWNRFDYHRHAIAGSGEPGQDYIARNNLVLEHAIGHVFDMHGENEGTNNGSEWAGGEMLIHDNTVLVDNQYALVVRGRPQHGVWFYDNCLARSASNAVLQRFFTGNFHIDESPSGSAPNAYNQTGPECEQVRWCAWTRGEGPLRYLTASSYGLSNLGFGDFDGDGKTDVFRTGGGQWHVVYGGTGGWQTLNSSNIGLSSLGFGDFDGDGKTDVFRATGGEWRMSSGGSSSWSTLRTASDTLASLRFGDFDGDGKTDVFRTSGGEWQWARSGTGGWQQLNASSYTVDSLGFGDFDGDGTTDVFSTSGGEWRVSWGGRSSWDVVNSSGAGVDSLAFADFDGDGKTDVFRTAGTQWLMSSGATEPWRALRVATNDLSELAFGDFDGDGRADVFETGCY